MHLGRRRKTRIGESGTSTRGSRSARRRRFGLPKPGRVGWTRSWSLPSGSSGRCGPRRSRAWIGTGERTSASGFEQNLVMSKLDLYSSDKLIEGLGIVFYVGMAVALLTALLSSPGWAFLLLVFGSFALVARTALESV